MVAGCRSGQAEVISSALTSTCQQSDDDRLLDLLHAGLCKSASCSAVSQNTAVQMFIEQAPLLAQQSDTLFNVGQQADLLVQQQLTGDVL